MLGSERLGTRFVHVGDVGRTDTLVEYLRGADTLVIESTYLKDDTDMAQYLQVLSYYYYVQRTIVLFANLVALNFLLLSVFSFGQLKL